MFEIIGLFPLFPGTDELDQINNQAVPQKEMTMQVFQTLQSMLELQLEQQHSIQQMIVIMMLRAQKVQRFQLGLFQVDQHLQAAVISQLQSQLQIMKVLQQLRYQQVQQQLQIVQQTLH